MSHFVKYTASSTLILTILLFLLPALVSKTSAKIYDPCELAKDMAEKYRFPSSDIPDCKFPAL
jgi:hypothetical protein